MIFQHTWHKVVCGTKTQTRRLKRKGEWLNPSRRASDPLWGGRELTFPAGVYGSPDASKLVWQEGKFYAVQPGRGKRTAYYKRLNGNTLTNYDVSVEDHYAHLSKKQMILDGWSPAEIMILTLRDEDVRDMSFFDVVAEGFGNRIDFWKTWCGMHDKSALPFAPFGSYEAIREYLMTRPADRYQAWVLAFMLV